MKLESEIRNRIATISTLLAVVLDISAYSVRAQTGCAPPPPGLVSWWQAESNAVDIVGGNDGQLLSGAGFAPGKVGMALSFDGLSSQILLGDPASLAFTNSFSIEGWIWINGLPPASQGQGLILYRGDPRYCLDPYYLGVRVSGNLRFHLENAPCGVDLETGPVPMQQWQHVAAVFDGSTGSMQVYVDGQLAAQTNTATRPFQNLIGGGVSIGNLSVGQNGMSFNGLIDELAVYARALSVGEIQSIYNAGSSGKCVVAIPPYITSQPAGQSTTAGSNVTFGVASVGSAPLSYQWSLNGAILAGATAATLSLTNVQMAQAGNYAVQVTNAAGSVLSSNALLAVESSCRAAPTGLVGWWRGEGNANDAQGTNNGALMDGTSFASGLVGEAFNFNGMNQYVEIPDSPSLDPSNVTLETWVCPTAISPSTGMVLLGKDGASASRQYLLVLAVVGNEIIARPHVGVPSGFMYFNGTTAIPLTTWTHLAMTYDGSSLKLYVNGTLDGSLAVSGGIIATPEPLRIGGLPSGSWYFTGLIDEPSIYSRALAASEVQGIYDAGAAGKCQSATPPSIVTQPANQNVGVDSTVSLNVVAGGTIPLSYQWSFNGTNLVGATDASLTLTNVQISQSGDYAVQVSNSAGMVLSSNALLMVTAPPACAPLVSGLVSWWRGEGDASDELGGNNCAVLGTVTYGPGKVGSAFEFDGVTSAVISPAASNLTVQSLTMEAWVLPTDISIPRPIVEYGDSTGDVSPVQLWYSWNGQAISPGCLYALVRDQGNVSFLMVSSTSGLIASNQWTHVALSFDYAARTALLYVNGLAVASNNSSVVIAPLTGVPVNLGYRPVGSGDLWGGRRHIGGLDEIAIYNRALSGAELRAIYDSGSLGKCQSPIPPTIFEQPTNQTAVVGSAVNFSIRANGTAPLSYQWSLNGTNLAGETGSSLALTNVQSMQAGTYAATVTNAFGWITSSNASLAVFLTPPCATPPVGLVGWWRGEGDANDEAGNNNGSLKNGVSFVAGKVGRAFSFDGISSYVEVPDDASLRLTNQMTIEFWLKRLRLDGHYEYLVEKGGAWNNGQQNYSLQIHGPDNGLGFAFNGGYRIGGTITDLDWHHCAAVATNGQADPVLYIDGVPQAITQSSGGAINLFPSTLPLHIGAEIDPSWTFYSQTVIDELAIYARALSPSEIQAIYKADSAGKCATLVAPTIKTQPTSQNAYVGGNLTFTVMAAGSVPLSYQWQFNGTPVASGTDSSLTLLGVSQANAGVYSVVVTNLAGSATSSNAVLIVMLPPASIQVAGATVAADGTVTVPVNLVANGNENAVGFSLDFDPALLTYEGMVFGSGASGGSLFLNPSQATVGQVGAAVALSAGATFGAGTQQLVVVSFASPIVTSTTATIISFGDAPIKRQLADAAGNPLADTFAAGTLVLPPTQLEGDVYPRPNGDQALTVSDWVLIGRYVAGLDSPTNALEFQKADCAPRATLGDGLLTVSDWVQAGRYVAGLDPLTRAGGPASAVPMVVAGPAVSSQARRTKSNPRQLRVAAPVLAQGQNGTVGVELQAQGNENALAFSLSFDPTKLVFTGATAGDAGGGTVLHINANQAAQGRLGCVLALQANQNFAAGSKQLVKTSFRASALASGNAVVSFADQPVPRGVSDPNASALAADYIDGAVVVNPLPSLRIVQSAKSISLSWPTSAAGFVLQESSDPTLAATSWTPVPVLAVVANNENVVSVSSSTTPKFYRLYHP